MDLPKYKIEDYCYQCGKLIETYADHIIKQVPVVTSVKVDEPKLDQDGEVMYNDDGSTITQSKKVKRVTLISHDFHKDCLPVYEEKFSIENEKLAQGREDSETATWNELYHYWNTKIYNNSEVSKKGSGGASTSLPKHLVMRLRGLRIGKYMPNRENVLYRDVGYPYEVILLTTKFKSADLMFWKKKGGFKNAQHEANYLMKIITDNIDFIYERYMKNLKAQQIADRRKFDFESASQYIRQPEERDAKLEEQQAKANQWLEDKKRKEQEEIDFNEL